MGPYGTDPRDAGRLRRHAAALSPHALLATTATAGAIVCALVLPGLLLDGGLGNARIPILPGDSGGTEVVAAPFPAPHRDGTRPAPGIAEPPGAPRVARPVPTTRLPQRRERHGELHRPAPQSVSPRRPAPSQPAAPAAPAAPTLQPEASSPVELQLAAEPAASATPAPTTPQPGASATSAKRGGKGARTDARSQKAAANDARTGSGRGREVPPTPPAVPVPAEEAAPPGASSPTPVERDPGSNGNGPPEHANAHGRDKR